jgi:hypothetical protein
VAKVMQPLIEEFNRPADGIRQGEEQHDHRAGGDLRPGAVDHPLPG